MSTPTPITIDISGCVQPAPPEPPLLAKARHAATVPVTITINALQAAVLTRLLGAVNLGGFQTPVILTEALYKALDAQLSDPAIGLTRNDRVDLFPRSDASGITFKSGEHHSSIHDLLQPKP